MHQRFHPLIFLIEAYGYLGHSGYRIITILHTKGPVNLFFSRSDSFDGFNARSSDLPPNMLSSAIWEGD